MGDTLETLLECRIVLNRLESTVYFIADMFTGSPDTHEIFNGERSRDGMFLQLVSIAETLKMISDKINYMK